MRATFPLALFLLTAAALPAQIQEIASTDDGSQLFFSTSFTLKGSSEAGNSKIFQYSNGAYNLIAQITPPSPIDNVPQLGNFHFPNPSGDGTVLTWDNYIGCQSGASTCNLGSELVPFVQGFVSGAQIPATILSNGALSASHNGRYFLSFNPSPFGAPTVYIYDSQTASTLSFAGYTELGDGRQSIADDGSAVMVKAGANVQLWKNGVLTRLPFIWGPSQNQLQTLRLSADGSTIVYESDTVANPVDQLVVYNVSAGTSTVLATGGPVVSSAGFCSCPIFQSPQFVPWISNDGQAIVFIKGAEVWVSGSDGSNMQQLTSQPDRDLIAGATLSGNGQIAFAVTANSALLQINVASGTVTTLIGDMPQMLLPTRPIVPGSQYEVQASTPVAPDGTVLIRFAEFNAPVISADNVNDNVFFQIPWEVQPGSSATVIASLPSSPFEQRGPVVATVAFPLYLEVYDLDFNPLGINNPAHPGDEIVLYMTGLGPVSPSIPTGAPGPLTFLTYDQLPLSCTWRSSPMPTYSETANILFAGLAPTFIGRYQVNLKVPADLPYPGTSDAVPAFPLMCEVSLPGGGASAAVTVGPYISVTSPTTASRTRRTK